MVLTNIYIPVKDEEIDLLDTIKNIRKNTSDKITIVDNNSSDNSKKIALKYSDFVWDEFKLGKGNIVKKILGETNADIIFLTDGDNTYDLTLYEQHKKMFIDENLDMLVGQRNYDIKCLKRYERKIANKLFNLLFKLLMGGNYKDICSGYRFIKKVSFENIEILSKSFEIETELSIFALKNKMKIKEVPIGYRERVLSKSKLKTFEDSFKIISFLIKNFL